MIRSGEMFIPWRSGTFVLKVIKAHAGWTRNRPSVQHGAEFLPLPPAF
jgi:hypothetical protein